MTIGIQRVCREVTPSTREQWTQLPCAGSECTGVIDAWFGPYEVELSARYAIRGARIRQGLTEQTTNPLLWHETQDSTARKTELRHSGYVKLRFEPENLRIEGGTALLVSDVEDKVGRGGHVLVDST
ncbi:MAG TPA: hypothetical protein VII97_10325 [Anaerolineales bacterium]